MIRRIGGSHPPPKVLYGKLAVNHPTPAQTGQFMPLYMKKRLFLIKIPICRKVSLPEVFRGVMIFGIGALVGGLTHFTKPHCKVTKIMIVGAVRTRIR